MKRAFTILRLIKKSFIDFVYPPVCLHCYESLEDYSRLFCRYCLQQLEMIDALARCPYCFSSEFNQEMQTCCRSCEGKPRLIQRMASVFDYEGAPSTLIKHLKYGGKPYLANGGGAYLAAQFFALNWPMPDFVIPMPMSRLRKWERGYNQSELLAISFAKLTGCSVSYSLKRRGGDFSQAGLDHQQRIQLSGDSFFVADKESLYNKSLLLIDDVMTTGTSLNCCADALIAAFPKSIYALTLCRTI